MGLFFTVPCFIINAADDPVLLRYGDVNVVTSSSVKAYANSVTTEDILLQHRNLFNNQDVRHTRICYTAGRLQMCYLVSKTGHFKTNKRCR